MQFMKYSRTVAGRGLRALCKCVLTPTHQLCGIGAAAAFIAMGPQHGKHQLTLTSNGHVTPLRGVVVLVSLLKLPHCTMYS